MFWPMVLNLNRGGMGSSQFWLQMQAEVVDRQFATKELRNSWSIRILELKVISLHFEIIYSCIENGFHRE